MARRLSISYEEAIRLLSPDESTVIKVLDEALGLGLLAVSTFSPGSALPYFDAKSELIAQLHKMTKGLRERVRTADRIGYEKLIAAAHAVIVVTAFTETLAARLRALDADGHWQKELRGWRPMLGRMEVPTRYDRRQLVEWAVQSPVSGPGPTRPFEQVEAEVVRVYTSLAEQALAYLAGLARWDELSDTQRSKIIHAMRAELPNDAAARYHEHFVGLAAQIPEFMAWITLTEATATRSSTRSIIHREVGDLRKATNQIRDGMERIRAKLDAHHSALGDLPALLAEMAARGADDSQSPPEGIAACHRLHQAVLAKPLLKPRLVGNLELIRFPTNEKGYINPNYRLIETSRSDEGKRLAQDKFWMSQSPRKRLGGFIAAYLRSDVATRFPLLVLGDPGGGKSLLSKVLAAQLPPDEFAVVRVELRHVSSSQEVSDQIDIELHRQTNNRYGLRDLTDPHGRITRVVIMDGLDELLQLSPQEGLGRYLERLMEFQEVEAQLGCPVITIATARTIVMDRIYVPGHTTVVKLEPFDAHQIASWLAEWNRENAAYFAEHHLDALAPETIERQAELARQPLLLALLALYDAEDNALRNAQNLSQPELYERILRRYLDRELGKQTLPVREDDQEELVEQRLRELSTIAMGMLNRSRRFVTKQEVEYDFRALGVHRKLSKESSPTSADEAVGQFFFLYRASARHLEELFYEGYEFIHSTFGEFLSARIVSQQIARAGEIVRRAPSWERASAEDHARSLLVPYLAQRPLVREEQMLLFLQDIVGGLVPSREAGAEAIAGLVPVLLRLGLTSGNDYHVTDSGHLERLATFTLNLTLIALCTAKGTLPLRAFSGGRSEPLVEWRRMTALWKVSLAIDDWDRVLDTLILNGEESPYLRYSGEAAGHEAVSIGGDVQAPGLKRMIKEARLNSDPELRGAATVWNVARSGLGDPLQDRPGIDWIMSAAFFRLGPVSTNQATIDHALGSLSQSSPGDMDLPSLVVGGPVGWTDEMLTRVATLLEADGLDSSLRSVLVLIRELEMRGSVADVRRVLARIPASSDKTRPADVASIVFLAHRHQMPAVLSRCVPIRSLAGPAIGWLSIEDISWIFQCEAYSPEELGFLRRRLGPSLRYKSAVESATQLLTDIT